MPPTSLSWLSVSIWGARGLQEGQAPRAMPRRLAARSPSCPWAPAGPAPGSGLSLPPRLESLPPASARPPAGPPGPGPRMRGPSVLARRAGGGRGHELSRAPPHSCVWFHLTGGENFSRNRLAGPSPVWRASETSIFPRLKQVFFLHFFQRIKFQAPFCFSSHMPSRQGLPRSQSWGPLAGPPEPPGKWSPDPPCPVRKSGLHPRTHSHGWGAREAGCRSLRVGRVDKQPMGRARERGLVAGQLVARPGRDRGAPGGGRGLSGVLGLGPPAPGPHVLLPQTVGGVARGLRAPRTPPGPTASLRPPGPPLLGHLGSWYPPPPPGQHRL